MKPRFRSFLRALHLWLGLAAGLFVCLMGFTGGLVALRPQIATFLSPPAPRTAACQSSPDWDRAARDASDVTHSEINRIYGPYGADTRWRFRMMTDQPVIYRHVIYDACSGKVLGEINLAWMDWTVDLHHNLLAGKTGRQWAGAIGIAMLASSLSGLLLWLFAKPDLATAFRINLRFSAATARQVHRAAGLVASFFLALEAFTGLWLCFPQTMRGMLNAVAPIAREARPARMAHAAGRAGLNDLMHAAHAALPDGLVREIRLPEGNGNVQVRMWRPGDFRSLGNNVVSLAAADARVLALDRYSEKPGGNRFMEAMAGLHYDEWGGLPFRVASAAAGFLTPLLFVTGVLLWWNSRRRKPANATQSRVTEPSVTAPQTVLRKVQTS